MHRNLFVIVCLFFFLVLGYGCDSGPQIAPVGKDSVVLAFGDSLTHGNGAPAGQSYPDVLAELLARPVINLGVPGEISAEGAKRLADSLDQYQPSLVILCHGGNDFLRRLDQAETVRNLTTMIEAIRAHGADVILVGVPKLGFGLAMPKFYAALAEQYAIPLEKEILLDLLADNSMKSDSIHPNAAGYRRMAEAIYAVISAAERKQARP